MTMFIDNCEKTTLKSSLRNKKDCSSEENNNLIFENENVAELQNKDESSWVYLWVNICEETIFPPLKKEKKHKNLVVTPQKFHSFVKVIEVACGIDFAAFLSCQGKVYNWIWEIKTAEKIMKNNENEGCEQTVALSNNNCVHEDPNNSLFHGSSPRLIEGNDFEFFNVISISAAYHHLACLTDDGRVFMVGSNVLDQKFKIYPKKEKKKDKFSLERIPQEVSINAKVIQISCNSNYCLLLSEKGYVYGMGEMNDIENESNVEHQRTEGNYSKRNIVYNKTLINFDDGVKIVNISAGDFHALALSREGRVYSWGSNKFGQLGIFEKYKIKNKKKSNEMTRIINESDGDNDDFFFSQKPCLVKSLSCYEIQKVFAGEKSSYCETKDKKIFLFGFNLFFLPYQIFTNFSYSQLCLTSFGTMFVKKDGLSMTHFNENKESETRLIKVPQDIYIQKISYRKGRIISAGESVVERLSDNEERMEGRIIVENNRRECNTINDRNVAVNRSAFRSLSADSSLKKKVTFSDKTTYINDVVTDCSACSLRDSLPSCSDDFKMSCKNPVNRIKISIQRINRDKSNHLNHICKHKKTNKSMEESFFNGRKVLENNKEIMDSNDKTKNNEKSAPCSNTKKKSNITNFFKAIKNQKFSSDSSLQSLYNPNLPLMRSSSLVIPRRRSVSVEPPYKKKIDSLDDSKVADIKKETKKDDKQNKKEVKPNIVNTNAYANKNMLKNSINDNLNKSLNPCKNIKKIKKSSTTLSSSLLPSLQLKNDTVDKANAALFINSLYELSSKIHEKAIKDCNNTRNIDKFNDMKNNCLRLKTNSCHNTKIVHTRSHDDILYRDKICENSTLSHKYNLDCIRFTRKIEEFELKIDHMNSILKQETTMRKRAQKQNLKLQEEIESEAFQHHEDLKQLVEKINTAERNRIIAVEEHAELQKKFQMMREKHEAQRYEEIERFETILQNEKEKNENISKEMKKLEKAIKAEKEEKAEIRKQAENSISDWKKAHDFLENAVEMKNNQINLLNTQIKQLQMDVSEKVVLESKVEALTAKLRKNEILEIEVQERYKLEEKVTRYEEKVEEMKEEMNTINTEVLLLRQQNFKLTEERDAEKEKLLKHLAEFKRLEQEKEAQDDEIKDLQQQLLIAQRDASYAQDSNLKLEHDLMEMKFRIDEFISDKELMLKQISDIENEIKIVQSEKKHLQAEKEIITQTYFNEVEKLNEKLIVSHKNYDKANNQIKELQNDICSFRTTTNELQKKVVQLKSEKCEEKKNFEDEISNLNNQNVELLGKVSALSIELTNRQVDNENAKKNTKLHGALKRIIKLLQNYELIKKEENCFFEKIDQISDESVDENIFEEQLSSNLKKMTEEAEKNTKKITQFSEENEAIKNELEKYKEKEKQFEEEQNEKRFLLEKVELLQNSIQSQNDWIYQIIQASAKNEEKNSENSNTLKSILEKKIEMVELLEKKILKNTNNIVELKKKNVANDVHLTTDTPTDVSANEKAHCERCSSIFKRTSLSSSSSLSLSLTHLPDYSAPSTHSSSSFSCSSCPSLPSSTISIPVSNVKPCTLSYAKIHSNLVRSLSPTSRKHNNNRKKLVETKRLNEFYDRAKDEDNSAYKLNDINIGKYDDNAEVEREIASKIKIKKLNTFQGKVAQYTNSLKEKKKTDIQENSEKTGIFVSSNPIFSSIYPFQKNNNSDNLKKLILKNKDSDKINNMKNSYFSNSKTAREILKEKNIPEKIETVRTKLSKKLVYQPPFIKQKTLKSKQYSCFVLPKNSSNFCLRKKHMDKENRSIYKDDFEEEREKKSCAFDGTDISNSEMILRDIQNPKNNLRRRTPSTECDSEESICVADFKNRSDICNKVCKGVDSTDDYDFEYSQIKSVHECHNSAPIDRVRRNIKKSNNYKILSNDKHHNKNLIFLSVNPIKNNHGNIEDKKIMASQSSKQNCASSPQNKAVTHGTFQSSTSAFSKIKNARKEKISSDNLYYISQNNSEDDDNACNLNHYYDSYNKAIDDKFY